MELKEILKPFADFAQSYEGCHPLQGAFDLEQPVIMINDNLKLTLNDFKNLLEYYNNI